MTGELVVQQSAEAAALEKKRARLGALREQLEASGAELEQLRAQLRAFEGRYLRQVGVLYAELDALEARIVEREVDLYDSDAARARAEEVRQRAQESHDAAYGASEPAEEGAPPPDVKALFREVAKRIHPDLARDEAERRFFDLLMARANVAYRRGEIEVLQRLLDDHNELHAASLSESVTAEALRVTRQIQHAERDLAQMEAERHVLLSSEVGQLHADAEDAAREHRDLLLELATSLREQIAEAERRFAHVDRQVAAHGR